MLSFNHLARASASSEPGQDARTRTVLRGSLALGAILTVAACYGIATQSLILGAPKGAWQYAYNLPLGAGALALAAIASAVAAALSAASARGGAAPRHDWWLLLLWMLAATALAGAIRLVLPYSLESVFVSSQSNSFYSVAQQHEPADLMRRFHRLREDFPLHAQSNMPGKVLLVYALQLVSRSPAVLPWLVMALSSLGAIPMYLFAAKLFEDRRLALYASVLYLFVPARVWFQPVMNTVTPVAVLGCACLLLFWLRRGSTAIAASLGAALFALAFFEPLPLVMGLLFAALGLHAIARGDISWTRFLAQSGVVALAFFATAELVEAIWGFRFFRTFRLIGEHAVQFNALSGRPYRIWVWANLREFVFGVGLCQAAAFLAALVCGLRGPGRWTARLTSPIATICVGLLAVVLVVDLLGVNRGEVLRLWIFLACFFQVPAAWVCARLGSRAALPVVVAASVFITVLGAATINFVVPA